MKILGQIRNKKLVISDYNRKILRDFMQKEENDSAIVTIQDRLPESRNVRKYYHGAVLPLWAFLNGWDYHDSSVIEFLHETAKKEFNGEIVLLDGKEVKKGKSTRGLLTQNDKQQSGFLERIITYLEENYAIDRSKVLNPDHYNKFADEIYSVGEHEDYIDYLVKLGFLTR